MICDEVSLLIVSPAINVIHAKERERHQKDSIEEGSKNQPDDTVAADMRIFHDGKNPLPVRTSSESIEEIRQPVFV